MEVPVELKDLYKHWEKHTELAVDHKKSGIDGQVLNEITEFALARMAIWEKRLNGEGRPFTYDRVLQKYRFCNIYRELDRQTIEIHKSLKQLLNTPDLWLLNMAFQRFICNPQTVESIGLLSFDSEHNKKVMKKLIALPRPKYGSAYVFPISVIQRSDYPTREEFFCQYLPQVIKEVSETIQTKFQNTSVVDALDVILPLFGYNFRFHWTEILIDVAYQYPDKIDLFKDFPIGPGSMPTMKRLSSLAPVETAVELAKIDIIGFPYLIYNGNKIRLSAENWEGIGCEFRKYSNLSEGKGRVRLYR